MTGVFLVLGFLAVIFIIYFLTAKPEPKELSRWDQMEGRTKRTKVVDVEPFNPLDHMGKKEVRCNHPGCPYPPEANLFYCRGHEGGFTVLVHSPPKDLGPVPEGVGDAYQPAIPYEREDFDSTSPAYDLFRTEEHARSEPTQDAPAHDHTSSHDHNSHE